MRRHVTRLLLVLATASALSACIVISREHTVERAPPRYDERYDPPPPPAPQPPR